MPNTERDERALVERLRETSGKLIYGDIEDGAVSVQMLCESADLLEKQSAAITSLSQEVERLTRALTDLSNMYTHAWDRVDGGLMMFGDSVDKFENVHHAAQVALGTAPPEYSDEDEVASAIRQSGDSNVG